MVNVGREKANTFLNNQKGETMTNMLQCSRIYKAFLHSVCASLIAQLVKNSPAMQQTPVRFLGREDPLEKGQATHSSILGLPRWLGWQRIHQQCRRPGFDPWVGKIPWRRERLPFLYSALQNSMECMLCKNHTRHNDCGSVIFKGTFCSEERLFGALLVYKISIYFFKL